MAKYEKQLTGDFDAVLSRLFDAVMNGSMSASYEDGSDWEANGMRCAVRVFERYSQAMFWKVNTMGEESFLETLVPVAEEYAAGR